MGQSFDPSFISVSLLKQLWIPIGQKYGLLRNSSAIGVLGPCPG